MYAKTVTIINPTGLHARPASEFVRRAKIRDISEVCIHSEKCRYMPELACFRNGNSSTGGVCGPCFCGGEPVHGRTRGPLGLRCGGAARSPRRNFR
ncbi:MAG: HPr family phosphocarrier protein [Synergistaceae bacterium]|nr:HPr family phosphocarrier protein [Synergistaceae bacterium]